MSKSSLDIFIEKANLKHNFIYNYSKASYVNSKTKIKIICPIHGEFEQIPNNHLSGSACPKCSMKNKPQTHLMQVQDFIKNANIVHEDKYLYSEIEYINSQTKIKIICPTHGIFKQTPNHHLQGHGCNKCAVEARSIAKTISNNQFLSKIKKVHNNRYDYSLTNYTNCRNEIAIICSSHGLFKQKPYLHLQGHGCPICNGSKGEAAIESYLKSKNINFVPEYRFDDCKNKNPLPFDFYLPEQNLCIEYDGIQHFKPATFGGINMELAIKNLELQKLKDNIKTEYCKDNNIKLIRIPYIKYPNIEKILNKFIFLS